jgi:hypothetical protein
MGCCVAADRYRSGGVGSGSCAEIIGRFRGGAARFGDGVHDILGAGAGAGGENALHVGQRGGSLGRMVWMKRSSPLETGQMPAGFHDGTIPMESTVRSCSAVVIPPPTWSS